MARPLTGHQREGTLVFSLPRPPGIKGRDEYTFPTQAAGDAWVKAGVAALRQGQRAPRPDAFRERAGRTIEPVRRPTVSEGLWAWWTFRYKTLAKAGPERRRVTAAEIRNRVLPFFEARVEYLDEISVDDVADFVAYLAGRDRIGRRRRAVGGSPTPGDDQILTLAQAAETAGVSKSTMRRAFAVGRFPHATRDTSRGLNGIIRVPVSDLIAAGYVAGPGVDRPKRTAIRETTASQALWILRSAIRHAMSRRLMDHDPTVSVSAVKPVPAFAVNPLPTEDPQALELVDCVRIASHLHLHHQIGFWLQRLAGLRLGETFGLLVRDIQEPGIAVITAQGGSNTLVEDEWGEEQIVDRWHTKTPASRRVVALPQVLQDLITLYIDAFRTDPVTGEPYWDQRLILPLRAGTTNAGSGYYDAVVKAHAIEGFTFTSVGNHVATHILRASFGADLEDLGTVPQTLLSRIMGHVPKAYDGGAEVTARSYRPRKDDIAARLRVVDEYCVVIDATIDTLLNNRSPRELTGTAEIDHASRVHADAVLEAALIEQYGAVSEAVDVKATAELLGVGATTVRRMIKHGELVTRVGVSAANSKTTLVTIASIEQHLAGGSPTGTPDAAATCTVAEAADLLGVTYHYVYQRVRRGEIDAEQETRGAPFRIKRSELEPWIARVRGWNDLYARSMPVIEAARELGIAFETASTWSRVGVLEVDPETDSSGIRYVTRRSVAARQAERLRYRGPRRPLDPAGTVRLADAATRLGTTPAEVRRLVQAGEMQTRTTGRGIYITVESLEEWIAGHSAA